MLLSTTDLSSAFNQAFDYLNTRKNNKPFIISDTGDNPMTAGGAGDVTWTLDKILKMKEFKQKNGHSLIYASIPGPQSNFKCH